MTTGSGDGEPVDLRSLHAADALFDRLAERRPDPVGERDAAVRLLRALLEDVETAEAAEAPCPPDVPRRGGGSLGVRTAVAVGVASAVLATGGVAAGWQPGEKAQPGHSAGTGRGAVPPERGQERPPDSRPSSLSITPST